MEIQTEVHSDDEWFLTLKKNPIAKCNSLWNLHVVSIQITTHVNDYRASVVADTVGSGFVCIYKITD